MTLMSIVEFKNANIWLLSSLLKYIYIYIVYIIVILLARIWFFYLEFLQIVTFSVIPYCIYC